MRDYGIFCHLIQLNTMAHFCLFFFVIKKNAREKYSYTQILCLAVKAAWYTRAPLFGGINRRQCFIVKVYFYENLLGSIHHFVRLCLQLVWHWWSFQPNNCFFSSRCSKDKISFGLSGNTNKLFPCNVAGAQWDRGKQGTWLKHGSLAALLLLRPSHGGFVITGDGNGALRAVCVLARGCHWQNAIRRQGGSDRGWIHTSRDTVFSHKLSWHKTVIILRGKHNIVMSRW